MFGGIPNLEGHPPRGDVELEVVFAKRSFACCDRRSTFCRWWFDEVPIPVEGLGPRMEKRVDESVSWIGHGDICYLTSTKEVAEEPCPVEVQGSEWGFPSNEVVRTG
jgi:hypothetical protein